MIFFVQRSTGQYIQCDNKFVQHTITLVAQDKNLNDATRVSGMDLRIHGIRFHSLESSFVKMNVADLDDVNLRSGRILASLSYSLKLVAR